jgi:Predicted membrane-associated Zn-dependent proteases 1
MGVPPTRWTDYLFPSRRIPVLDAAHLMFYAIERVRGERLRERWQALGKQIRVALVLALMAVACASNVTSRRSSGAGRRLSSAAAGAEYTMCI